ncbi:YdcF family protein [Paenibacillus sp.]|uniref:YdcF family protein n=1 Tax=Paenibacillus sp. TaxID=58172 RepID=UPI002D484010|nr:YdcF family protein [Paenibacillus sp.]HZG86183.1 YdcF family protein [Paenibacillus sp.]
MKYFAVTKVLIIILVKSSWHYRFLLVIPLLLICLYTSYAPILKSAGNVLKINCSDPARSDVIIVLGGEMDGERTRKGAELYKQGVAPKVMLSDGTKMSWRTTAIKEMYDLAVLEGVPEEDIIQENRSRSTYENALFTRELMERHGMTSAIVVTSDWHAKRSEFIFNKLFEGSGIHVNVCGTPDDRSDFNEWWKDGEKQQVVLTEWAKLLTYWARYLF